MGLTIMLEVICQIEVCGCTVVFIFYFLAAVLIFFENLWLQSLNQNINKC